jgi:hypothetical protein
MSAKKIYYGILGLVLLMAVLVAGSVFVANLFLEKQKDKLAQVKAENRVIEEQQTYLIQAKKDLEEYSELAEISQAIVPQDKDQAKTVREINSIAQQSGIKLDSITFPASSLGTPSGSSNSSGSSSAGNSSPTSSSGLTQLVPVEGISGVYALEITISALNPVPYYQFLGFLDRLEGNRRTAHVQNIVLNPTEDGNSLSFVLTLNAYVKP